jgi:CubicO group peptidase (beta-lactamase class C family)
MRSRTRFAAVATVLFALAASARAQAAARIESVPDDFAAIAEARRRIFAWMASTQAPGVSVAASRGGRLVWSEGVGCADLEQ